MDEPEIYLGDGAYAKFNGWAIELTTENGYETTNTIFLEPELLKNLFDFTREHIPEATTTDAFMNLGDHIILAAADRLHRQYPQQRTDLWISTEADGIRTYTAYLPGNTVRESAFGNADDPNIAVDRLISDVGPLDDETLRQKRIAQLQLELQSLTNGQ